MPKVVAFTCGAANGNCEILVKEALMALERMGIEAGLIRLNNCDLRPCRACPSGPCKKDGPDHCIYDDDGGWLARMFYEADGVILAAPVWSLAPPAVISVFRDRLFGYKSDVARWERVGAPEWAKGCKRHRPGALISVGGALTRNWTSLSLATLYTATISSQTDVVDQMDVWGVSRHGDVLLRDDLILRARYLGENLGHAVLNPQIDWSCRKIEPCSGEACPSCQSSLIIARPGTDFVECAICGRRGAISTEGGRISYAWPEDPDNRLGIMGKYRHVREIERHGLERPADADERVRERIKDYLAFTKCVMAPPRGGK